MQSKKLLLLLLVISTLSSPLCAQRSGVEAELRGGNNATFGNFAAISLVAQHDFENNFALRGGVQQSSFERFTAEVRPSYSLEIPWGQLRFEALLHHFSQSNMQNFALGGGVGIATRHLWATFGYYHRTLRSGGESLAEPFNLYYEFGVSCLPSLSDWDLRLSLTNSRMFDLERHYVPSLVAEGWWYPSDKAGVRLGVCYKPTGVFHISSDYYQLYASIGVCYRW